MSKLLANGAVILALCLAGAAQAQEKPHARHHHRYIWQPAPAAAPAGDIIVRTPAIPYTEGFISNGYDWGADAANGLSGDDSYPPPRGFHGGLYSYGVYAWGPGGPYDKKEVVAQGFDGWGRRQVSGMTIGNDGLLYVTAGAGDHHVEGSDGSRATVLRTGAVFRCQPDGAHLHVFAIGFCNLHGHPAFDLGGNLFALKVNGQVNKLHLFWDNLPGLDPNYLVDSPENAAVVYARAREAAERLHDPRYARTAFQEELKSIIW